MIERSIAFLNGKGGVLKTTLAAHVSAIAALGGWRVLVVDLDPQGNLAVDFGAQDQADGGAGLYRAVAQGTALEPLRTIRPGVDLVAGGPDTGRLAEHLRVERQSAPFPRSDQLLKVLAPLAVDYNLVVLDCPPGDKVIHAQALATANFVIVPTQPDVASINGLAATFEACLEAQQHANVDLQVLGVVLGPIGTAATAVKQSAVELLEQLVGGIVPVFDQTIRLAQAPAVQARQLGVLVHELADLKRQGPKWYQLSKEERAKNRIADASGLSEDLTALTRQILRRLTEQSGVAK